MRIGSLICIFSICALSFASASEISHKDIKKINEDSSYVYMYLPSQDAADQIRISDAYLYPSLRISGEQIAEKFINFIFPISGKEKRVEFLPYQYWGQKKPQFKRFQWKMTESQHFVFYSYESDDEALKTLIRIFESHHEDNSKLFGVDNRIPKKIPILLYKTRSDFEQTNAIPELVPESLGGFTEVMSWKRAVFPFEGDKTTFEHVTRHEGTHIYQIAKRPEYMPLWFIEGLAESNSIKWDADAETVMRDAYFNKFVFPIKDLWQVSGTWLMYKEGSYITNFIIDNFGKDSIRTIFDNSRNLPFDKNIKKSLGIEIQELEDRVFAKLNARYGKLGKNRDDVDNSHQIGEGKLLAAYGDYFMSGRYIEGKFEINLNYVDTKRGVITKKVISDFELDNETLHNLKSRTDINAEKIAYSVGKGRDDVIRVIDYYYSQKKGK